jgi:nucleoside-diphosphate-sugar epimerase
VTDYRGRHALIAGGLGVIGSHLAHRLVAQGPTSASSTPWIHKLTGEKYHEMYAAVHGLRTVILRVTNPSGERDGGQAHHHLRGRIDDVPWRLESGNITIDISKLHRATGWQPSIGLEEGIERMVRYYAPRMSEYLV